MFDLTVEQYINFGCYPGAVGFLNDLDRWGHFIRDAIVEPVIGRDLLQLHPVDNPALLSLVNQEMEGLRTLNVQETLSLCRKYGS